jgi:hypothetical protein
VTRPLAPAEFADRVDRLDRDDLRAFVAAVLDAAGGPDDGDDAAPERRVRVLGRRRRLPDADGGGESVAVVRGTAGADLRERARERGVRVVDVDDLRDLTLYGLPPAEADEQCRRYLGSPARVEGTGPTATLDRDRDRGRGRSAGDDGSGASASATPGAGAGAGDGVARLRSVGGGFVAGVVVALLVASVVAGGVPGLQPAGLATPTPGAGGDADADADAGAVSGTGATATPVPPSTPVPTAPTAAPIEVDDDPSLADRYARLAPRCDRPPGLVVATQVALFGSVRGTATGAAADAANGTNASVPAGIRAAYRFASPTNRRFVGSVDDFERVVSAEPFAPLLNYTSVAYGPVTRTGDVATRRVTVVDATGAEATYEFTLVRQSGGQYDGCWMTEGVTTASPRVDAA